MPALALAPKIELPPIGFFGRTLAEYAQLFALDIAALRGRAVLDVAAGPASFTAEACRRGIDAVAIDPLYGTAPGTLAAHVELDGAQAQAELRAKPRLLRAGHVPLPDAAEFDRRTAATRFLEDYATHFARGRYIGAALPRLPYFDGAFDLVLCAQLLFVHAARFDFDWHLAACRELVRVSAGEVRIHPLSGAEGKPYAGLPRLRRELQAAGIASEVKAVDYEFFIGSSSMLVLRKANP